MLYDQIRVHIMKKKIVVLLSGGIDSPVAAHLLAECGAEVSLLGLDNRPFTDDKTLNTIKELAIRLKDIHGDVTHHLGTFGHIQKKIALVCDVHVRCLICRRMMYRAGELLADQIKADSIATGESLGQVASQTLSNIATVDEAVEMTIHRPLIGLDKNEIIDTAKMIETYDISIQPTICCMLTPEEPSIRSEVKRIKKEEEALEIPRLLDEIKFKTIDL